MVVRRLSTGIASGKKTPVKKTTPRSQRIAPSGGRIPSGRVTIVSQPGAEQAIVTRQSVEEVTKQIQQKQQEQRAAEEVRLKQEKTRELATKQTEAIQRRTEPEMPPPIRRDIIRSEIQPAPERKGFFQRSEDVISRSRFKAKKDSSFKAQALGVGVGVTTSVLGTLRFGKELATQPVQTVKETGVGLFTVGKKVVTGEGFPKLGRVIATEPGFAVGFVGAELLTLKGAGAGIKLAKTKVVKPLTGLTTRLSPKFKAVETVDDVSKISKIPSRAGEVDIKLAGPIKTIEEPVARQARQAGKLAQPVTAQRGLFGRVFKKEITVEKPLPTPDSPQLERALFADPKGRLRPSRLGVGAEPETAGLSDLLSGDVTFKKPRPQAVFFEKQKVEKFPKELKSVEEKLKAGKPLTVAEQRRLETFQLTPSGEFKPVGFISKEPEITLAPGERIRKVKTRAVTLIEGQRVPIIEAEVVKPSTKTQRLLEKKRLGTLTQRESKQLSRAVKVESSAPVSRRFVSPSTVGITSVISLGISRPIRRVAVSRAPSITSNIRTSQLGRASGRPSTLGSTISAPPSAPPSGPPSSPPSLGSVIGGPPSSPPSRLQPSPPTPPPLIPRLGKPKDPIFSDRRRRKLPSRPIFKPSIVALEFDIQARVPKGATVSGVGVRPVPLKKGKKRKIPGIRGVIGI